MERVIKEIEAETKFNHLPYFVRIRGFLWRKKFRFIFLAGVYAAFNYWGNLFGLFAARMERVYKKYKRRWITRYNPHSIAYESALETVWQPNTLSRKATD